MCRSLFKIACRGLNRSAVRARFRRRLDRSVCQSDVLEDRVLLTIYTVNTILDQPANGVGVTDGLISLREAIQAANTNTAFGDASAGSSNEADEIHFDASLSGQVIDLAGSQLTITGSLVVSGLGRDSLSIDANGQSRVFNIAQEAEVELDGLRITGGTDTSSEGGGAIRNAGTLTVTDSRISGRTTEEFADGGAIHNAGTLHLVGSSLSDSTAMVGNGGGLFNSGSASISETTFQWNYSSRGDGGAISNEGQLTVEGSLFENNYGYSGGAIHNSGSLTITGTAFKRNIAYERGGAIDSSGTLKLQSSSLRFNNAQYEGDGGGIFSAGTTTVINSTISANRTEGGDGGGVAVAGGSTVIRNSTISDNQAQSRYVDGYPFGDYVPGRGGGIAIVDGNVTLHNTIVIDNDDSDFPTVGPWVGPNDIAIGDVSGESSHNIVGVPNSGGLTDGVNGNTVGVSREEVIESTITEIDGGTSFFALIPNSLALNAGSNSEAVDAMGAPLTSDQRGVGFKRISGGTVDIGAIEVQYDKPRSSIVGFTNGNWWVNTPDDDVGFNVATSTSSPASVFQLTRTGDFNGDGVQDIAVWLNNGDWQIGLADGMGRFTFSRWTTWRTTDIKEIHVGDFNDDGKDDIIGLFKIANRNRGRWWVGVSDGTRFASRSWGDYGNYAGIEAVLVGNFDGVKGDDLSIIASSGVVWMVKTSNTRFQYLNSHSWNISHGFDFVQVGNFNGDTRDDILAVFGTGKNRSIFVAKSVGPALGFYSSKWTDLTVTQSLDAVEVGDFDGDGRDNVVTMLNGTRLWTGRSDGKRFFMSHWLNWSEATGGLADLSVGESNGDGLADLFGRASDGMWHAAESNGSSFVDREILQWAPQATWQHVRIGQFTAASAEASSSAIATIVPAPAVQSVSDSVRDRVNTYRWQIPQSSRSQMISNSVGETPTAVSSPDEPNGTGERPLANSYLGIHNRNIWLGQRDATGEYSTKLAGRVPFETSDVIESFQGYFNGDPREDIAYLLSDGRLLVGISNPDSTFTFSKWTTLRTTGYRSLQVGDFNGDGLDDILGVYKSGDQSRLWGYESNGTRFYPDEYGTYRNATGLRTVLIGNFDGMNGDDVAIYNSKGRWWVARSDATGSRFRYGDAWERWDPDRRVTHLQAADFNDDGADDIIGVFDIPGKTLPKTIVVATSQGLSFDSNVWAQFILYTRLQVFLVGDFNGDSIVDFGASGSTATKTGIGDPDNSRFVVRDGRYAQYGLSSDPVSGVADTNGDSFNDILSMRRFGNYWLSMEANETSASRSDIDEWSRLADFEYLMIGSFAGPPPTIQTDFAAFGEEEFLDLLFVS